MASDAKEKIIQEFVNLMRHLEYSDYHDEINNKLADIIRNVRKTYTVSSRDNDDNL